MNTSLHRRTFLAAAGSAAVSMPFVGRAACQSAVTIRVSSSLPADVNSSHFVWFARFSSALNQLVGNKVALTYFPNNQLGKESDVVQQVVIGSTDMMISGTSIWATALPDIGVLDLGYIFDSNEHAGKTLDGPAGKQLLSLLREKTGAIGLGFGYSLGARNVYTKSPVKSPSDLNGVKIRVLPVPNFVATLKAMGAVATPIPFGEIYTALQSGVVEGVEQDAPTVLSGKFFEIAKHCILTQHIFNPVMPVISRRAFDRLPADVRSAMEMAAADATSYQRAQAGVIETKAFEELKRVGVTVSAVDRAHFSKLVSPLWGQFATQYPATKPIIDAIRSTSA